VPKEQCRWRWAQEAEQIRTRSLLWSAVAGSGRRLSWFGIAAVQMGETGEWK